MPLLKILCKEIELQAKGLAEDEGSFYGFLPRVLTVVNTNLPPDPAAAGVLNDALGKVAAEVINSGRVSKLQKLHEALRTPRERGAPMVASDPRLAAAFAEAITRLAAVEGPAAETQALPMLRYCAEHVNVDDRAIQRAAGAFAKRRAAVDDARSYSIILRLQATYPSPELLQLARDVLLEMRKHNRFEEMVIFFSQARVEFGRDARTLTPYALAALENISSPDQRAQLMKSLWFTVQGEFEQRQMPAAARQWHLEYGDMELALNQLDKARERYQTLLKNKDLEPELMARVALRLAVLQFTRPAPGSAGEILLSVLALDKLPVEYKLAARLLGAPDQLRLEDLDAQLKVLGAPALLTDAEWDLFRGVRLRMDGNQAAARDLLAAAARKAPSLNFPKVTPAP
ncbi:MAG: hypothetical protein NTW87_21985 [Planctomycetota bacterium]|nr:hypothetical protein [Planctomycetota bacterium]